MHGDYGMIVDWLEVPDNFLLLHGGSQWHMNGKFQSKNIVYCSMLVVLHATRFPAAISTGDNLGKRVARYIKHYWDALQVKSDSCKGLTKVEVASDLSIKDKLERLCPHFAHMHILFSKQPNITPPALGSSGLPTATKVYAERALIAPDDNVGSEMVDNDFTTGNIEQGAATKEEQMSLKQSTKAPTHLFGWRKLRKVLLTKSRTHSPILICHNHRLHSGQHQL